MQVRNPDNEVLITENLQNFAAAITKPCALMGLDYGTKTIGLAVCDALWMVATPIETVHRTTKKADFETIGKLVESRDIKGFVVGWPLEMDGNVGERAKACKNFAQRLTRRINLPVLMWDERLSTTAVERTLIGEADLSRKKRGKVVDRAAAAFILQGAMDGLKNLG